MDLSARIDLDLLKSHYLLKELIQRLTECLNVRSEKIIADSELKEKFLSLMRQHVPSKDSDECNTINEISIELFNNGIHSTVPLTNKFVIPPYIDCAAARVAIAHLWLQNAQNDAGLKLGLTEYDQKNENYSLAFKERYGLTKDLENHKKEEVAPSISNFSAISKQIIDEERARFHQSVIDQCETAIATQGTLVDDLWRVS